MKKYVVILHGMFENGKTHCISRFECPTDVADPAEFYFREIDSSLDVVLVVEESKWMEEVLV